MAVLLRLTASTAQCHCGSGGHWSIEKFHEGNTIVSHAISTGTVERNRFLSSAWKTCPPHCREMLPDPDPMRVENRNGAPGASHASPTSRRVLSACPVVSREASLMSPAPPVASSARRSGCACLAGSRPEAGENTDEMGEARLSPGLCSPSPPALGQDQPKFPFGRRVAANNRAVTGTISWRERHDMFPKECKPEVQ